MKHFVVKLFFVFCISLLRFDCYCQNADTVENLRLTLKNSKDEGKQLMNLSKTLFGKGSYELAAKAAKYAADLFVKQDNLPGQAEAYERLTAIYVKTNDSIHARQFMSSLSGLSAKTKKEKYSNIALYYEGKLQYQLGNFLLADSLSKIAYKKAITINDTSITAKTAIQIANINLRQGNYKVAGENYINALKMAEMLKDSGMLSVCLTNLGTVNRYLNDCNSAVFYHKKSLAICIQTNNRMGMADAYGTLGDSYSCANKHDSSIAAYKAAIPLQQQFKVESKLATTYSNLGAEYQLVNQLDSALHYLELAKTTGLINVDSIALGNILWSYGDALFAKYKESSKPEYLEQALANFLNAKYISEKFELSALKIYVYKSLAKIYEIKKLPGEELRYLKLYNVFNDSVLASNYTSQVAEMQTKYETEKKENEINKLNTEKLLDAAKLSRQRVINYSLIAIAVLILAAGFVIYNNIQKKRKAEKQLAILEKQNAVETMRSKIASDVHDDMGANLTKLGLNAQQLISVAVNDQQRQLADKVAMQSREVITGMKEIIWASNPANDNLKSMLGFMRQYIDRFFDGTNIRPVINFPYDVGEIELHPIVRRNLFLILKEALNNAVKYSGTDKIDIDFNNSNQQFNLHIKDYGKGIDEDRKDEFGNGLNNMQMRAQQIHALLRLVSTPGAGVQIAIEGKLY
ncbi:MAG: tetratricopeptide repeat protein [Ferruginibacter sp.]